MNIFNHYLEASKKYPFYKLMDHVTSINGNCVVCVKSAVDPWENIGYLLTIMRHKYRWDYDMGYIDKSIYFEVSDREDVIYGGVYDLKNNAKITKVIIAAPESTGYDLHDPSVYIYRDDIFKSFIEKIKEYS